MKKKTSEWNSSRFETLRLPVEKYLEIGQFEEAEQILIFKLMDPVTTSYYPGNLKIIICIQE